MVMSNCKTLKRRHGILAGRSSIAPAIALAVLLSAAGCALEGYLGYIPTPEELEAYDRQMEEFNAQLESLPLLAVRIVNNTEVTAGVELESGLAAPEPGFIEDLPSFDYYIYAEEDYLTTVDEQAVLIAPGGTATGTLKCGEVIAVSASAPFDGVTFGFDYGYGENEFGLYIGSGNVQLTGVGMSSTNFEGDVITTVRFVRPEEDDIDCETDVLVIEIDTVAVDNIFDEETGELLQAKTPGTGTLSVEPSEPEEG